jgi:MoaA/NifB/PqqE/SkfB family radical SAM enzyme
MPDGTGLAGLLLHIGRHANSLHKRRMIENLVINWGITGSRIRQRLRTPERWIPQIVAISPTMRCNLACSGCYSALYSKDGELSEDDLDRILQQCRSIGAYLVVLTGGEPYLLREPLLRLFRKHRDIFFLTFTNGTLFDEPLAAALAGLGNVCPAISVEGYEEHTDERRSRGVYLQASRAMALLEKHKVIFGISVTYTAKNVDLVTSDEFVRYYMAKGALFGWYFMFMPVGKDPILDLVPTPEQRLACGNRIHELRKRHPMFLADFWNDGPAAGGCLAAGRRYLHILNSGRVEPCVYAHFGVDNIRQTSLLQAANSPFFRAIRREFPFNDAGNLKRPCMIVDNPEVLRRVVRDHVAPGGHPHAEDLISDPHVASWIDAYARRFRDLTDPAWREMNEDPTSRWYKGKEEYRNLFRFRRESPGDDGGRVSDGNRH